MRNAPNSSLYTEICYAFSTRKSIVIKTSEIIILSSLHNQFISFAFNQNNNDVRFNFAIVHSIACHIVRVFYFENYFGKHLNYFDR